MYNSKKRSSSTSRKSPEHRIRPWLRARIHPYCWGQSDRNKKHFRQTKIQRVFGLFHSLRSEGSRRYLPRITNDMMIDHFLGRVILYFQADGRYKAEETLIEIDIDCSNSRPLEWDSSWFAHFDGDRMIRHHRDVEKDLRCGLLGPEPARFRRSSACFGS